MATLHMNRIPVCCALVAMVAIFQPVTDAANNVVNGTENYRRTLGHCVNEDSRDTPLALRGRANLSECVNHCRQEARCVGFSYSYNPDEPQSNGTCTVVGNFSRDDADDDDSTDKADDNGSGSVDFADDDDSADKADDDGSGTSFINGTFSSKVTGDGSAGVNCYTAAPKVNGFKNVGIGLCATANGNMKQSVPIGRYNLMTCGSLCRGSSRCDAFNFAVSTCILHDLYGLESVAPTTTAASQGEAKEEAAAAAGDNIKAEAPFDKGNCLVKEPVVPTGYSFVGGGKCGTGNAYRKLYTSDMNVTVQTCAVMCTSDKNCVAFELDRKAGAGGVCTFLGVGNHHNGSEPGSAAGDVDTFASDEGKAAAVTAGNGVLCFAAANGDSSDGMSAETILIIVGCVSAATVAGAAAVYAGYGNTAVVSDEQASLL